MSSRTASPIIYNVELHFVPATSPVELAGATGLEPATSCVTGRRSNQLNYAPAYNARLMLSGSLRYHVAPCRSMWPCRDSW